MSLPAALVHLTEIKAWVIWRKEIRNDKPTKPPRQVQPPHHNASSGDPTTWSTYEKAASVVSVLRPWQGIGFNLMGSSIIGIDLDKCVDDEGHIAAWAWEIIERCASYAEISPSGTGVRIIGQSKSNTPVTMLQAMPNGGRMEIYCNCKRYLTITGRQISKGNVLAELDDVLAELSAEQRRERGEEGAERSKTRRAAVGVADSSSSGVFHKMVCKLFDSGLEPGEVLDKIRRQPKRWEDTKAGVYEKEDRLPREVERCWEKWREGRAAQLEVAWSNGRIPMKTCTDAKIAIEALGVVCRADRFHLVELVEGELMGRWGGLASDDSIAWLRKLVWDRFRFDPGKEHMRDAVHQLALENAFDPVLDYINEQQEKWDNKARIDRLAVTYFGCLDTELNRMIGRTAMIAAVRRVRDPGAKFDQIIVLEGEEGTNKSTAIEVLAGTENFSDQSILGLNDRQQQEALQGRWLYEIADLKGINHAEVEAVKAFASRREDRARPAYGHYLVNQKRRTILFATTNDKNYLKGDTGNRRWWPLPCGRIKINLLRRDRDQLWAEAAELEAQGESLTLPQHLWGDAKREQDERLENHPWMERLREVEGFKHRSTAFPGRIEERVSSKYLLDEVILIEPGRQRAVDGKIVRGLMQRLGWKEKVQRMEKGKHAENGYWRLLGENNKVVDLDEERRRRTGEEE